MTPQLHHVLRVTPGAVVGQGAEQHEGPTQCWCMASTSTHNMMPHVLTHDMW